MFTTLINFTTMRKKSFFILLVIGNMLTVEAQEKKEEVFEILGDKYEHLKGFFEEVVQNGGVIAGDTKKKIVKSLHQEEKKLRETAAEWDKEVHEKPWAFLGGVALGSLVLGLILGRKK